MTREEFIECYINYSKEILVGMLYDTIIEYEEKLKEAMGTKSCDLCKYSLNSVQTLPCSACIRSVDTDYYKPKEAK